MIPQYIFGNCSQEKIGDEKAIGDLHKRILELDKICEHEKGNSQNSKILNAKKEREFLYKELRSISSTVHGPRNFPNEVEKARKAVSKSIYDSLKYLQGKDMDLWRHLHNSIGIGKICLYRPERNIHWVL